MNDLLEDSTILLPIYLLIQKWKFFEIPVEIHLKNKLCRILGVAKLKSKTIKFAPAAVLGDEGIAWSSNSTILNKILVKVQNHLEYV